MYVQQAYREFDAAAEKQRPMHFGIADSDADIKGTLASWVAGNIACHTGRRE